MVIIWININFFVCKRGEKRTSGVTHAKQVLYD